ncbi:MAG: acireductone synthase [Cyanobacteria bacterium J06621_15]
MLQQVRDISEKSNLDVKGCISQLMNWQSEDKKITPLKTLQGLIWREGYDKGELKAHVYPDAVYSSGSIAAQKLLFGNTSAGDLTSLFSAYFDTTTGSKKESESYTIPQEILFLSNSSQELIAASEANLNVCGLNRDVDVNDDEFTYVNNFSQILLKY